MVSDATPTRQVQRRFLTLLGHVVNPLLPNESQSILAEEVAGLSPSEKGFLVRVADSQLLLPAMSQALSSKGLMDCFPAEFQGALEAALLLNRDRNARLVRQAVDLSSLLAEIDAVPVFLKGTAQILARAYPDPGCRMTSDLDVLLPADRLEDAQRHLLDRGFALREGTADTATFRNDLEHHLTPLYRDSDLALVELHYAFFPDPEFLCPAKDILAKAEQVCVAGQALHIPCPEHRLTMAIGHAMLRSLNRFGAELSLRDGLDMLALIASDRALLPNASQGFAEQGQTPAFAGFTKLTQRLFGGGWQRPNGHWQDGVRARLMLEGWMTAKWREALNENRDLRRLLFFTTSPLYRRHTLRVLQDSKYRSRWRSGWGKPDKHG